MNLEYIAETEILNQDEHTGKIFGNLQQLTIVGWRGRKFTNKSYIVTCSICSLDEEVFGQGLFSSTLNSLHKGRLPCGCAEHPRWTKEQTFIQCARLAKERGYEFYGFHGKYKRGETKISLVCSTHGEWHSTIAKSFKREGVQGCPKCRTEVGLTAAQSINTKSEQHFIESFLKNKHFNPDSKFWKSERTNKTGGKVYWWVSCADCGTTAEAYVGDLQKGSKPCDCPTQAQRQAYIMELIQDGNVVALKFGVTNSYKTRTQTQARHSTCDINLCKVFFFTEVGDCRAAERECKANLECCVISREVVRLGFTETTHPENYEKIQEIYTRHGGQIVYEGVEFSQQEENSLEDC